MPPIALSDDQLNIITRNAEPLLPQDRDQYLRHVASLLDGVEIGTALLPAPLRKLRPSFSRRRFVGQRRRAEA